MDSITEFYTRIYWENKSDSLKTPLGKTNLNKMDSAIKLLDTRTVALYAETVRLDTVKADKTQLDSMIVNWEFDEKTGIIKITRYDGAVSAINTTLNKLAVNFIYDAVNEKLIITQADGTEVEVDMSALITQYEFLDTDTVSFFVDASGKVSAIIKEGSIGEKHLNPDYLAEIKIEVAKAQGYAEDAQESADNAAYDAKLSQSYAVGGSGIRDEEDTSNSKYYYELTKQISENSNTIESSETTYQLSLIGTEIPSGAWQEEIPVVEQGMFLWTRIVLNYSNGDSSTFYSVAYSGVDGTGGGDNYSILDSFKGDIPDEETNINVNFQDQNFADKLTFISTNQGNKRLVLNIGHYNDNYGGQIAINPGMYAEMWIRSFNHTFTEWVYVLTNKNYESNITKLNGVTFQDQIFLKKGSAVTSALGETGSAGYINFARIKILDNYANHTCYFTIQNRGIYFPIILSLGFQNINHTDPGLISFLYWGAADYGIYAVKNTTSTWDLYVKKTEIYDEVEILSLNYNTRYLNIIFPDGFVVDKGENWMSPQPGGRVAGADHVYDSKNGAAITASYSKPGMTTDEMIWLTCWDGYEMRAINKSLFTHLKLIDDIYGMCIPGNGSVDDEEWIRTTKNGLLPYQAGTTGSSSLGTSSWYFLNSYVQNMSTYTIHSYSGPGTKIELTGTGITMSSKSTSATSGVVFQLPPTSNNTVPGIYPIQSGTGCIGTVNYKWNQFYATNSTISTSDRNEKKDISYIGQESEYENTKMSDDTLVKFVKSLRPCIFLRKDGESGRPHHGFISQDFKKTMDGLGITDHAAYIKSPKSEIVEKEVEQEREVYDEVEKKTKMVKETVKIQEEKVIEGEFVEGLRYEEVIPDITRFCQILYQQNQEQQELINLQQKEMNDLKVRLEILEKIVIQA